jgi:hypothetical protein
MLSVYLLYINVQSNSQKLIITISALVLHMNGIENFDSSSNLFLFSFEDFGFRSSFKIELSSGPVLIKLDLN